MIGVDPVFTPSFFAFRIHEIAFPRHVTFLFWATYHVQFPPTNHRHIPVYFTIYRSFSPVLEEIVVVSLATIFASLLSRTLVAHCTRFTFETGVFVFSMTGILFLIAPGIMRSIPILILALSASILIVMISAASTWYLLAISEIVSPDTTLWITPETGGIMSTCQMVSSSSSERSLAQSIASVLILYISEILRTLSLDFTICFLLVFLLVQPSFPTVVGVTAFDDVSPPIRMSPISEI